MTLEEAFPEVDSGVEALGGRVLLQLKLIPKSSKGGIILVDETKDTERVQSVVGKVVSVGPLAFMNRETAQPWIEGSWVVPGDFVRTPRWSGDRFSVPHPSNENELIDFQILNDYELWCKVKPEVVNKMKAFVL